MCVHTLTSYCPSQQEGIMLNNILNMKCILSSNIVWCMHNAVVCAPSTSSPTLVRLRHSAPVSLRVVLTVWLILLLGQLLGSGDKFKLLNRIPECGLGGAAFCWVSFALRKAREERVYQSEFLYILSVWGENLTGILPFPTHTHTNLQLRIIFLRALIWTKSH